jgi:hypothetical protein
METWYVVCFWLAAGALVFQPLGVLVGHYGRGRALEGGLLGLALGPIGIALIFLVLADRRPLAAQHVERHGDR